MYKRTERLGAASEPGKPATWLCHDCGKLHPKAKISELTFVNKTGVCPRCQAREMAKEE